MNDHSPIVESATNAASLSVNALAQPLIASLLERQTELGIAARRDERGVLIVDAGIEAPGSAAAGAQIAAICMGGLGTVQVRANSGTSARDEWPTMVEIASAQPVLACLASQYAGWSLAASKEETGGKKFFALG